MQTLWLRSLKAHLLFFFLMMHCCCDLVSDELGLGTLIVTYSVDSAGDRLDRIRFWLINEQHEKSIYPKREACVCSVQIPNQKTVVIPALPAGRYKIQFLLPNSDERFKEIPVRSVILQGGEVVKIDQVIHSASLRDQPNKLLEHTPASQTDNYSNKELG